MSDIIATVLRASVHRFIGRLGKDPQVKYFENGRAVANATMAVNQFGAKQGDGKEPDWFKLEIWGDGGVEFCDKCRKGDLVEVEGRVRTNRWTDRSTGEEKRELLIGVSQWRLVHEREAPAPAPAAAAAAPAAVDPLDEEVPF